MRALVVASPAILTSISSISMGVAIDGRLARLNAERDAITRETGQLDLFAREFETKELQRASFLLGLTAASADDRLKYTLDKLYRLNAAGSLRRIAASLYPTEWQDRTARYDALIASDYHEAGTVQQMQAFENEMLQVARKRLTDQQAAMNRLSESIGRLETRKSTVQTALNAVMYVLTILIFFLQTAA